MSATSAGREEIERADRDRCESEPACEEGRAPDPSSLLIAGCLEHENRESSDGYEH